MAKSSNALTEGSPFLAVPTLAELKAKRVAQREAAQRVEELKLRLFQMTEQHMDQAVIIIKSWVQPDNK